MKKRIFIAIHYLEIGGAEISLIGLLNALDTLNYEVDLFVYSHQGELMKLIPSSVHLLPQLSAYSLIERPIKEVVLRGHIGLACARLWAKYSFSRYARKNRLTDGSAIMQYVFDAVDPFLPNLKKLGEYDMAISFLTPHNIVLNKVRAKKKIAWIHTDYSRISVNQPKELRVWRQYDNIASISPDVTRAFLQVFPSLKHKIVEIANILSPDYVRNRALEAKVSFQKKEGRVNLLSIGRFTSAKNFDNVPDICRRMREVGCNVYWYLIGYGGEENLIRHKIKEAGMEDFVILLGKKENPYPYIAAADIYVQPSRFEGNAVTVREAQILCKPVAVARYGTASSQINDGVDGIIVSQDNLSCALQLVQFIQDRALQKDIVDYLQHHDYGNESEVTKLYQLID